MTLLKVNKLSKSFGGLKAVSNLNIELENGELIGLIGPNGAGKTTAFNLLTGVYEPTEGEIIFQDKNIAGFKPYRITHRGMARTFQNIRLFGDLTVIDNVKIAFHQHAKYSTLSAVDISSIMKELDVNIASLAVYHLKNNKVQILARLNGERVKEVRDRLVQKGYDLSH